MFDNSRVAATRAQADSELKKALLALNVDDYGTQLPLFRPFIQSVKQLFFEEADDLLRKSGDPDGFQRDLRALRQRIIDEYTKAPEPRRLTDRQRRRTEHPMPIDQTLHIEPADKWDIFSPMALLPHIKNAVRKELEGVLGGQLPYWLGESLRRVRMALEAELSPTAEQQVASVPIGAAETSADASRWEDLARGFAQIPNRGQSLSAQWFAHVGSENYGIWLLRPEGRSCNEARTEFSLVAAKAIEKLEVSPLPIPRPEQYFPYWRLYCEVEGGAIDLSDAVPHGLGAADEDAPDPCSRAWLELLRRESPAFEISSNGTLTIRGAKYPTVGGQIRDVARASTVFCWRQAREAIRQSLETTPSVPNLDTQRAPHQKPSDADAALARSPAADISEADNGGISPRSVPVSSRAVMIVRGAGTPQEKSWVTSMGGDFHTKGLFQPPDKVVAGDEIRCEVFAEPRVVKRVRPVLAMAGNVVHWEAALIARSEWSRNFQVSPIPSKEGTISGPQLDAEAEIRDESALSSDKPTGFDFTSEARRNEAIGSYKAQWDCSEASLARTAIVDPADLSKWKKGTLPHGSEKKARIEKALKENQPPTPAARRDSDF